MRKKHAHKVTLPNCRLRQFVPIAQRLKNSICPHSTPENLWTQVLSGREFSASVLVLGGQIRNWNGGKI